MGVPAASKTAGLPVGLIARAPMGGAWPVTPAVRSHRRTRHLLSRAAPDDVIANGIAAEAAPESLNFDELTNIIRMVNESDIVELELKRKGFNLSVKKQEAMEEVAAAPMPAYAPAVAAPPPLVPPAPAAPSPAPAAAAAAGPPPPAATPAAPAAGSTVEGGREVTSPMAGTFYRSPAPGEPSFVKEGDRVEAGQTICIVEAMKLMNEIEADSSGEVVKFLVENGNAVTPGLPLLLLK